MGLGGELYSTFTDSIFGGTNLTVLAFLRSINYTHWLAFQPRIPVLYGVLAVIDVPNVDDE